MKVLAVAKAVFWLLAIAILAVLGIVAYRAIVDVRRGMVRGAGDPFVQGPPGKIIVTTEAGAKVLVHVPDGKSAADVRAVKVARGIATVENRSASLEGV